MGGNAKLGVETTPVNLNDRLNKVGLIITKLITLDVWDAPFGLDLFAGSSAMFMDPFTYPSELLIQHGKTTFGDIDVMIPNTVDSKELLDKLWLWEGVPYSGGPRRFGDTVSMAVDLEGQYVQFDFELKPFENGRPTEFSKLSNSYHLRDLEAGIKGVFHKQLLCALTASEQSIEYVLHKRRGGKEELVPEIVRQNAFSVSKGLRRKYERSGIYYIETPTSEAEYTTDLDSIYRGLFGRFPDDDELAYLGYFDGVCDLINRFMWREAIKNISFDFYRRLDDLADRYPSLKHEQIPLVKKRYMENIIKC